MTEWILCPGCHLNHSARPDGLCPRCHQPIAAFGASPAPGPGPSGPGPSGGAGSPDAGGWPSPPPHAALPPPAAGKSVPDAPLPRAVRIAGALLVVLAISNLVASAAEGDTKFLGPSVIDVVLGGALALGLRKRGLIGFAIFRAAAGGVVFGAYFWATQGPLVGAIQILLSAGFLLLLVGRAGLPRLAAGTALAGLMIAVNLVGVAVSLGGDNPLAELAARFQGYEDPVERIEGLAVPWTLDLPGGHWRPRDVEEVRKENPDVDRLLTWPAKDAAIVIIAERLPDGQLVPLDALTDVVVDHARKSLKSFREVSREPLVSSLAAANVVRATADLDGQAVVALYGVFVDGNVAIQVTGLVPAASFDEVEPELREILGSLRL